MNAAVLAAPQREPLAWIDPQTAEWTEDAYVRRTEGPWNQLERAPLDREGWNYSMFGGIGTYESADGRKAPGSQAEWKLLLREHPQLVRRPVVVSDDGTFSQGFSDNGFKKLFGVG